MNGNLSSFEMLLTSRA